MVARAVDFYRETPTDLACVVVSQSGVGEPKGGSLEREQL